jgi:hypothetical protein
MQEGQPVAGADDVKPTLKTIFDDYVPPEGITLHDPSPPSAVRMVFQKIEDDSWPRDMKLLGSITDGGNSIRVIRRMGDQGITVRDMSAAMRTLRGT